MTTSLIHTRWQSTLRLVGGLCFWLGTLLWTTDALALQPGALPAYALELAAEDLLALQQDPGSNTFYPATLSFDGQVFICQVRYRGVTARYKPKKSWKLKFPDRKNPFEARETNFNADYVDLSIMRNALMMRLFQFMGFSAPDTKHVNLNVNGEFAGVYVQVEEVDEDFLRRNGLSLGNLYKSENHGASMGPLLKYDDYAAHWNIKIGAGFDYSELQLLFNQFYYMTYEDFGAAVPRLIDVDNFLQYFAVVYVASAFDNATKNFFLYFNPDTKQYQLIPWDLDSTLGNHWSGEYRSYWTRWRKNPFFRENLIFQRLLEYDHWREEFWRQVERVTGEGFEFLELQIDSTYRLIRQDVYRDRAKIGTNAQFDDEMTRLKDFFAGRRAFLADFRFADRVPLSGFFCSNPFPTAGNRRVVFRAFSPIRQSVAVDYILDLDLQTQGDMFNISQVPLFDDGAHDDLQAGDGVYGNWIDIPPEHNGIIPYVYNAAEDYRYPESGFRYINFKPAKSFALSVGTVPLEGYRQVGIGQVYSLKGDFFVEVVNSFRDTVDLSYCSLQAGSYYQRFTFPIGTRLGAGDTLVTTTNRALAAELFPGRKVEGNMYFGVEPGDTLRLLSTALTQLDVAVNRRYGQLAQRIDSLVISEINYHAADDFNTEDWLELFNPNPFTVSLADWSISDGNDGNLFRFPAGAAIEAGAYVVVCQDLALFRPLFPEVENLWGDLGFGFKNSGERIYLYNEIGALIDEVAYRDQPPWPEGADGDGYTLELLDASADNSSVFQWAQSRLLGGSPGRANSVNDKVPDLAAGQLFSFAHGSPNPFSGQTMFTLQLARAAQVHIEAFNALGQSEGMVYSQLTPQGIHPILWMVGDKGAGVYFVALSIDGKQKTVRKVVNLGF